MEVADRHVWFSTESTRERNVPFPCSIRSRASGNAASLPLPHTAWLDTCDPSVRMFQTMLAEVAATESYPTSSNRRGDAQAGTHPRVLGALAVTVQVCCLLQYAYVSVMIR